MLCGKPTPEQARINLETTIAIERAVATGKSVRLPPEPESRTQNSTCSPGFNGKTLTGALPRASVYFCGVPVCSGCEP